MRVFLPALAAIAVAGCATVGVANNRVTYRCDRGPLVTVVYAGKTARIVGADGRTNIVLTRRPSGSGLWYESPTHTIRSKGDWITYTVGRATPMTCRKARQPR
jgi:membrane-bound inhibitor of C-type lysozyme